MRTHSSVNNSVFDLQQHSNFHVYLNKTRGLQLCPVFHFTTQWFSNPRCGQNMTTLLPKYGPSNGFFLNLNQCAKGCSMPNFTFLAKSCSPIPRNAHNVALLWPKHGPHMVLQMGSSWILTNVPRDAPCQISLCCLSPVAPFPRNGQNMALLWPKHGPHMVLQISSSWILINVPRDASCHISQFWGFPVVPIS